MKRWLIPSFTTLFAWSVYFFKVLTEYESGMEVFYKTPLYLLLDLTASKFLLELYWMVHIIMVYKEHENLYRNKHYFSVNFETAISGKIMIASLSVTTVFTKLDLSCTSRASAYHCDWDLGHGISVREKKTNKHESWICASACNQWKPAQWGDSLAFFSLSDTRLPVILRVCRKVSECVRE